MRIERNIAVVLIGISLVLVACSPVRQIPSTAQIIAVDVHDTVVEDWRPSTVVVDAGGVVTWLNAGYMQHKVISSEGLFNLTLSPGQSFNYTFTHSGNFTYHDDPYNSVGTIVVK
jgi:plastocyanin